MHPTELLMLTGVLIVDSCQFCHLNSTSWRVTAKITLFCILRFMKLRLDRVLKLELGEATPEEALKSLAPVPDFKPLNQTVKNYTAPYPPYKPGWWQQFEHKE